MIFLQKQKLEPKWFPKTKHLKKRKSKHWSTVRKGSILKARDKKSYTKSLRLTTVIAILVILPACSPDELGMHLRPHQTSSSSDSPSTCADL